MGGVICIIAMVAAVFKYSGLWFVTELRVVCHMQFFDGRGSLVEFWSEIYRQKLTNLVTKVVSGSSSSSLTLNLHY